MAEISLAILVALACFTTAVSIITGTADFMAERLRKTYVYQITVTIACVLGIVMGAFSVNAIIEIALPVLMLIYPLTIALILLNVMPAKFRTTLVMRATVIATIIFSLPDALKYVLTTELFGDVQKWIPISNYGLGWVTPAFLAFLIAILWQNRVGRKTWKY